MGPDQFLEDLRRENGVIPTQYTGSITFSPNDALPVHRWWPYVQGFSAEFVDNAIVSDHLPAGASVLDPFCGSGTTLVEARRSGHRAIGGEILAPAALAARVKTHFELDPKELLRQCDRVLARGPEGDGGKGPLPPRDPAAVRSRGALEAPPASGLSTVRGASGGERPASGLRSDPDPLEPSSAFPLSRLPTRTGPQPDRGFLRRVPKCGHDHGGVTRGSPYRPIPLGSPVPCPSRG